LNDLCEWFVNVSKEWYVSENEEWFMNDNNEWSVNDNKEWYVTECKEWLKWGVICEWRVICEWMIYEWQTFWNNLYTFCEINFMHSVNDNVSFVVSPNQFKI